MFHNLAVRGSMLPTILFFARREKKENFRYDGNFDFVFNLTISAPLVFIWTTPKFDIICKTFTKMTTIDNIGNLKNEAISNVRGKFVLQTERKDLE